LIASDDTLERSIKSKLADLRAPSPPPFLLRFFSSPTLDASNPSNPKSPLFNQPSRISYQPSKPVNSRYSNSSSSTLHLLPISLVLFRPSPLSTKPPNFISSSSSNSSNVRSKDSIPLSTPTLPPPTRLQQDSPASDLETSRSTRTDDTSESSLRTRLEEDLCLREGYLG